MVHEFQSELISHNCSLVARRSIWIIACEKGLDLDTDQNLAVWLSSFTTRRIHKWLEQQHPRASKSIRQTLKAG